MGEQDDGTIFRKKKKNTKKARVSGGGSLFLIFLKKVFLYLDIRRVRPEKLYEETNGREG